MSSATISEGIPVFSAPDIGIEVVIARSEDYYQEVVKPTQMVGVANAVLTTTANGVISPSVSRTIGVRR